MRKKCNVQLANGSYAAVALVVERVWPAPVTLKHKDEYFQHFKVHLKHFSKPQNVHYCIELTFFKAEHKVTSSRNIFETFNAGNLK